jgi:uncharacterized membrane protein HdeD (DUF308 family)
MTDLLSAVLGLSFASGLNSYATVLCLGLLQRFEVVHLPDGLSIVGSIPVLAVAGVLYFVEFFADKVPWFDTVWDGLHTFIRPLAGAVLAYGVAGNIDPKWQVVAALVGGGVALTSHAAKATTRAAVNVSPEPFSNWILSLTEDVVSFGLVWLVVSHPVIALAVVLTLVATAVFVIWKLSHLMRRAFRRQTT